MLRPVVSTATISPPRRKPRRRTRSEAVNHLSRSIMLAVRLAVCQERPVPKILGIGHIRTNRDALREADARHCQPPGAGRIGSHHDLSPFGPNTRGPIDAPSVPAN